MHPFRRTGCVCMYMHARRSVYLLVYMPCVHIDVGRCVFFVGKPCMHMYVRRLVYIRILLHKLYMHML